MTQRELSLLTTIAGKPYPTFPSSPIDRIRWTFQASIKSPTAKSVAVVLAVYADLDGKAWPALDTIASDASLNRRTVIRAINHLEETGWLTCQSRAGGTTVYWPKSQAERHCGGCWTVLPADLEICPSCGAKEVTESHPRGDRVSRGGDRVSPKETNKRQGSFPLQERTKLVG